MNYTILCVDDESSVLQSLRTLLSKLGNPAVIEIAESGAEALEIASDLKEQGRELAVIVSDFIMPQMRGDELLIQLHAMHPHAIKIMLTGQSAFDGVKRAINQASLYRFIEKPFDNDDLLLTVKSAWLAFLHERETREHNRELVALNAELERMLETIQQQHKDLATSEAKATLSTLIASVSHELGSPIGNGLLFSSSFIGHARTFHTLMDSGQMRRSELDQFVATMIEGNELLQKNLQRANALLLNLKQVAADQASEQRRRFDLIEVVNEIIATLAPSLRNKAHRIIVDVAQGIVMDSLPGALGQIVINIVNNAYRHAFEGVANGVLRVEAIQTDGWVTLRFSDNGVGIPEANMARLLEPFFSTRIGRGGTGLGLTIVDNLVRKSLGGTLEVRSVLGQGTVLSIRIPCTLAVPLATVSNATSS